MSWPISFADVLDARDRIRSHLPSPPLRSYAPLDAAVGGGVRVLVKHENHCPADRLVRERGLRLVHSSNTPHLRHPRLLACGRGPRDAVGRHLRRRRRHAEAARADLLRLEGGPGQETLRRVLNREIG